MYPSMTCQSRLHWFCKGWADVACDPQQPAVIPEQVCLWMEERDALESWGTTDSHWNMRYERGRGGVGSQSFDTPAAPIDQLPLTTAQSNSSEPLAPKCCINTPPAHAVAATGGSPHLQREPVEALPLLALRI